METPIQHLILFDGICNFCNSSINFIIKKDKHRKFKFATLQSKTGQYMLQKHQITDIDSVILIEREKAYVKSDAVLKIGKTLGGVYRFAYVLILIPKFLRNPLYDFIAKNRYKWFGQKNECMIPTPDVRERFMDA